MQPTPYPELNVLLQRLVESAREALNGSFIAACLQGSFAVGDFDRDSDVDFVIVTEEEPSVRQVDALRMMHGRIHDLENPWARHIEGSYFPRDILADYTQRGKDLWYLDHGSRELIRSNHCNTAVVRWVVREHGVALAGANPAALVDPIPVDVLRHEMRRTILDWGREILAAPEHVNNWWYQTYIVLNYCRMLHDLQNGFPGSKRAGAEWAKTALDPKWHGLIDRSWLGRPTPELSCRMPANDADLRSTMEFVKYVINSPYLAEPFILNSCIERAE